MALRQLRGVRALHTTPLARQSAAEITSDFLARLTADSNGPSRTQSQADNAARGMIGAVGLRHSASEDGRRQFRPNEVSCARGASVARSDVKKAEGAET